MHIVHLTASTMYGGPERQMLGLANALPATYQTSFISFREGGRSQAFLDVVRDQGFHGYSLASDFPKVLSTIRELTALLESIRADLLLVHGYKANILGQMAARRAAIPVVAISRGWTRENWKVRQYERLDRYYLRHVDRVVAVSDAQAEKLRAARVPDRLIRVIRNAARLTAFNESPTPDRTIFQRYFPDRSVPNSLVLSAGRLSPEKGFDVLVEAANEIRERHPDMGFLHFGDGPERIKMERMISEYQLHDQFKLGGFISNLDRLIPNADLVVLPSYTEGLPNILLEAGAAGIASVATRVGGTPEVVEDGVTGRLVPSGDPTSLARAIIEVVADRPRRLAMGRAARERMECQYSFAAQARAYEQLFRELIPHSESKSCLPSRANNSHGNPSLCAVPSGSVISSTI